VRGEDVAAFVLVRTIADESTATILLCLTMLHLGERQIEIGGSPSGFDCWRKVRWRPVKNLGSGKAIEVG
jgi:hypothetical protein